MTARSNEGFRAGLGCVVAHDWDDVLACTSWLPDRQPTRSVRLCFFSDLQPITPICLCFTDRQPARLRVLTGLVVHCRVRTGSFRLYDYGSPAANRAAYGSSAPPDVAANYGLVDIPVDLVAGEADGVVSRESVLKHYDALRDAGCRVTYKCFNFGHLDFTFAVKSCLTFYVASRLLARD